MLNGHFELSSGLHSNEYFQCAKLLQHPEIAEQVAINLAKEIDFEPDLIVGPALGGIIIAYELGRALKKRAIFAERKDGILCFRRGFQIDSNERVLIVEDVITTAKSALETAKIIEEAGGIVSGYACIVDRSNNKTGLSIKSLLQTTPQIYEPDNCPLCNDGIPVYKPGSRVI
jgi:orotate phosphoribosyltransferase